MNNELQAGSDLAHFLDGVKDSNTLHPLAKAGALFAIVYTLVVGAVMAQHH